MNAWFPRITGHSLVVALSLLTYVLTTRAERERRPPSVAIAWVLGLIALPYVALPSYLLFGRRKLPRKVSPWSGVRCTAKHWAEHLIESFGLPAAAPSHVRMHADGAAARSALFDLMGRARRQLDVCTYILGQDAFGEEATLHMMACVRRGVRVRFLIDGVGAMQLPRAWFREAHAAGVETAIFSPFFARKTPGPRNLRNHRKWAIADRALMWAGGRNLAAEYFCGTDRVPAWLDLSFDLEGPAAASAAAQFEADWKAAGGRPGERIDVPEGGLRGGANAVPAERSGSDRRHGACLAHRCVLSGLAAHVGGHPLLRARRAVSKTPCAWPPDAASRSTCASRPNRIIAWRILRAIARCVR